MKWNIPDAELEREKGLDGPSPTLNDADGDGSEGVGE
jgi:hypothetical protein